MPVCNGLDRGSNFALTRKGADLPMVFHCMKGGKTCVCEALAFQSIFVIFGFMRYLRRVFIKNSFTNPSIEILSKF